MPTPAGTERKPRRRYPAAERRASMLADAAIYFADHGFESSTRDLAAALGVTQALIYKHFDSKEDLIEQTLESVFTRGADSGDWIDPDLPPEQELLRFYRAFVSESNYLSMRLFIRAGLDGRSWPTRRGHRLTRALFLPAIAALRRVAGLPALEALPAIRGERELVMMLHAAMVFLGIRRHVYGMPMPDNLDDVVALYVRTFVAGAIPAISALHEGGERTLAVPLAAPNR